MKKTLVSALTTALVVGAASTTFAAANPFSDVPADHWAIDAVSQLAADGVLEGYGDGTFRGDRNITRYEVAQMVARAMAKSDVSAADKAMIDKLAAEFADELNSLGVRVSNLERNADMVKWNGELRYTYTQDKIKHGRFKAKEKNDELLLRLEPTAEVNDHWHVKARLDATTDMAGDTSSDLTLKRAWAQGDYKNFSVRFGKFSMYGNDSINDKEMSGADITIGNKNKVSGVIGAGRASGAFDNLRKGVIAQNAYFRDALNAAGLDASVVPADPDSRNSVFYAGVDYNRNENKGFYGALRYFRYANDQLFLNDNLGEEKNDIWMLKAGYNFGSAKLHGLYAKSNYDEVLSNQKKAYNIEFDYKGAQKENRGTWGAWVAYRYLGYYATPAETWDVTGEGLKGWAIGANYTFAKNIVGTIQYGDNKFILDSGVKVKQYFGRVEWFF